MTTYRMPGYTATVADAPDGMDRWPWQVIGRTRSTASTSTTRQEAEHAAGRTLAEWRAEDAGKDAAARRAPAPQLGMTLDRRSFA